MKNEPNLTIRKTTLEEILPLRYQFLQAVNYQIRYDSCHIRHWADEYLFIIADQKVGYGSVKGKEALADRDAIFEFYVLPTYEKYQEEYFKELIKIAHIQFIECQSNDLNLTALLYEFAHQIYADTILFEAGTISNLKQQGLFFRRRQPGDYVFGKSAADEGEFVLVKEGEIVADGGFLLHYNKPFADLYMETAKTHRRNGYASFILQELKKACYLAGRVPAARCRIDNKGSKAALLKAGMEICGYMLTGEIKKQYLSISKP